jgi:hypothetical protein
MNIPLIIICVFTALIHFTESTAYSMRLSGVRTKQIAISMAFVSSTLLISRLSNMVQAPLLGTMVDGAIMQDTEVALSQLKYYFRFIILSASCGVVLGMILTPTSVVLFQKMIKRFLKCGSLPRVILSVLKPSNTVKIIKAFRLPKLSGLRTLSLKNIPKQFLIINVFVTSIYCIGVLCSLLAGAYLPEIRSTAIQLSGIVNGMATIMFTIFVDPSGARVTDQAVHGERSENDVRSVVFFMQLGKLFGTLVLSQLLLWPFSKYVMVVTKWIAALAM